VLQNLTFSRTQLLSETKKFDRLIKDDDSLIEWREDVKPGQPRFRQLEARCESLQGFLLGLTISAKWSTGTTVVALLNMSEAAGAHFAHEWGKQNAHVFGRLKFPEMAAVLHSDSKPSNHARGFLLRILKTVKAGGIISILFKGCGTTREADKLLERASLEGLDVSSLRITSADSLPWTSNVTVAPPHERVLEGGGVHVVSSSTGVFRCPRNDTAVNVEAMLADVEEDGYALFTEDFAGRRALKTVYDYLLKLQDVGLVYEVQQTYFQDGCVLLSCKKGTQAATAVTLEPPRVEP
jgi:hypothetical protein